MPFVNPTLPPIEKNYPKKYPNFTIPRCAIRSLMLQNDYVLETSRSIGVSRSDGIRLQFLYGRLLMNRHRRMDPGSTSRFLTCAPSRSRASKRTSNKRPCILETLDACWGVCQVRVAQWLRLTAQRHSATGRRPQAGFGHIFLDDEFHSSLLVRPDRSNRFFT